MPLRISFQSHHPLCRSTEFHTFSLSQDPERSSDEAIYPLPFIQFVPHEDNLPHLVSIRVETLCNDPTLQAALSKRFGNKEKVFSPPHKLLGGLDTQRIHLALQQNITQETKATLRVTAQYKNSDATGQPVLTSLESSHAEAHLTFFPNAPFQKQITSSELTLISPPPTTTQKQEKPIPKTSENPFPGWLAIDFGTSNSTVALYDPKEVAPMRGLAKEQLQALQRETLRWLRSSPHGNDEKGNPLSQEWKKFLEQVGSLQQEKMGNSPVLLVEQGDENMIHKLLRDIELWLRSSTIALQRWGYQHLHKIYSQALRVPPLTSTLIFHAELDPATSSKEISSEIHIKQVEPVLVETGPMVQENRKEDTSKGRPIEGRYYASIKRYLGREQETLPVAEGELYTEKPAGEILRATWSSLLEHVNKYRELNPTRHSKGPFQHVLATYPTVAPPHVRKEIIAQLKSLGIEHVNIKYDEAVAAAIFYFMCATGGGNSIGIESFLSRCRQSSRTQKRQNVLVFDIGGGTTDIALIQLNIHERHPHWEPDEDQGAGGRYYEVIPRLLGSSGHTQLGGDLLSLRTFYLLKASLADQLLSTNAREICTPLLQRSRQLGGEPFFVEGVYQPNSLVEHAVLTQSTHHEEALHAIELLLPTRWKQEASKAQAFYSLWQYAEEAKIHLGKKMQGDALEEPFELPEHKLKSLLLQFGLDFQQELPITLRLERSLFEKAILPDLEDAVQLAKGLLSRLPNQSKQSSSGGRKKEPLDWLILSGQTCQLSQVEQTMRKLFASHEQFSWNPERVTKDPHYAKLATSAGACYAESLWRLIQTPEGSKEQLRKGIHQFYFNVKNLYYFLPCTFLQLEGRSENILFDAGTELKQLSPTKDFGSARSKWLAATLSLFIQRRDHDEGGSKNWGSFTSTSLCERLQISDQDWQEHIKLQWEVNHQLQFQLFLCRGKAHHLVQESDICLRNVFESLTSTPQAQSISLTQNTPTISDTLRWDIAVGLGASRVHTEGSETILFEKGTRFKELFHASEDSPSTRGLISPPLPEFSQHTQQHQLYARNDNGNWTLLGTLHKPKTKADYPIDFRITIDELGQVALFAGEVPYLTSEDPACLVTKEGHVYIQEISNNTSSHDESRDPFSGEH